MSASDARSPDQKAVDGMKQQLANERRHGRLRGRQGPSDLWHMAYAAAKSASLGPAPGEVVAPIVLAFYLGLAYIALFTPDEDGELAHGNVHV